MASIGIAGATMVAWYAGLKAYTTLALLSLLLATVWLQLRIPATTPQGFMIGFYQHVLGRLDGRSCPSYPVCSVYAREALQQHGVIWGSWLTMDRLIHETDDVKTGPTIMFDGELRLYDPLSRNDFWLRKPDVGSRRDVHP